MVADADAQVADTATTFVPFGEYDTRHRTNSFCPDFGTIYPLPDHEPWSEAAQAGAEPKPDKSIELSTRTLAKILIFSSAVPGGSTLPNRPNNQAALAGCQLSAGFEYGPSVSSLE